MKSKEPVNTIKIERLKLKSGLKTYRVEVDRKKIQEHFQDALQDIVGSKIGWGDKEHLIVDGLNLLESGARSGRFAIFNCTCGSGAECAGIENKIEVEHSDDRVCWKFHAPLYNGERSEKLFFFNFHKPQYLKELLKIEKANDLEGLPGYFEKDR